MQEVSGVLLTFLGSTYGQLVPRDFYTSSRKTQLQYHTQIAAIVNVLKAGYTEALGNFNSLLLETTYSVINRKQVNSVAASKPATLFSRSTSSKPGYLFLWLSPDEQHDFHDFAIKTMTSTAMLYLIQQHPASLVGHLF